MKINKYILKRYAQGECTNEEEELVEAWFAQLGKDKNITDKQLDQHIKSLERRFQPKRSFKRYFIWTAAAACIGVFFFVRFLQTPLEEVSSVPQVVDIKAPTTSSAVIVLDDQSEFLLDSLRSGDTLQANGYLITRLASGEIHYLNDQKESSKPIYNTLRTKVGDIAHVRLSDGSKVWLNSNSELKYLIDFTGMTREVYLSGEGYFEIEPDGEGGAKKPFFVRGDSQTIKVLGTRFNVDFGDFRQTALLQGKIAIADTGSDLESQSEQSYDVFMVANQVYKEGRLHDVSDISRYIDWKEGYFDLNEISLETLAVKLSKWYGIEFQLEDNVKEKQLFGQINRYKDLYEVLELIEEVIPVKCQLFDDKIIITNTNN